jgi:hypothetical protein
LLKVFHKIELYFESNQKYVTLDKKIKATHNQSHLTALGWVCATAKAALQYTSPFTPASRFVHYQPFHRIGLFSHI